jgi:hypothetical protein
LSHQVSHRVVGEPAGALQRIGFATISARHTRRTASLGAKATG